MRTSITVVLNNGVRQKVAPSFAHKVLGKAWGRIPADDPASQEAYAAYVASLSAPAPGDSTDGEAPPPAPTQDAPDAAPAAADVDDASTEGPRADLPEGYRVETSGFGPLAWFKVFGPDGEQVGKAQRTEEDAVQVALEHATAPPSTE